MPFLINRQIIILKTGGRNWHVLWATLTLCLLRGIPSLQPGPASAKVFHQHWNFCQYAVFTWKREKSSIVFVDLRLSVNIYLLTYLFNVLWFPFVFICNFLLWYDLIRFFFSLYCSLFPLCFCFLSITHKKYLVPLCYT